jgi:hypothetical protein
MLPRYVSTIMPYFRYPVWMPNSPGRLPRGTELETMVNAPFWMPDVPMPAMARPTINILDDVDTPHSRDPNMKMKKKVRKVHWLASQMMSLKKVRRGEQDLYLEVSVYLSTQRLQARAVTTKLALPEARRSIP